MLVLSMNSKRQRKPNVRLWDVGDFPAAFTCSVSPRIKTNLGQKRGTNNSARRNESKGNNDISGFPQQFPPDFGFLGFSDMKHNKENKNLEFGISSEMSSDIKGNSVNNNLNSMELDSDCSVQAALSFGYITRKSRLKIRRRRTPNSLFLDPWGSKVHPERNAEDFTSSSGCNNDSLGDEIRHCDGAEFASPLSTGEWLEEVGFGKYAKLFELHEVDGETLPLLTLDDLKEMGIFAVGIRWKLFSAIKRLTEGNASRYNAHKLIEHI